MTDQAREDAILERNAALRRVGTYERLLVDIKSVVSRQMIGEINDEQGMNEIFLLLGTVRLPETSGT